MSAGGRKETNEIRPEVELLYLDTVIRYRENKSSSVFTDRDLVFKSELPEQGIVVNVGKQNWRVKLGKNGFLDIRQERYFTTSVKRGTFLGYDSDGNFKVCPKKQASYVALKDCQRSDRTRAIATFRYEPPVQRFVSQLRSTFFVSVFLTIVIFSFPIMIARSLFLTLGRTG